MQAYRMAMRSTGQGCLPAWCCLTTYFLRLFQLHFLPFVPVLVFFFLYWPSCVDIQVRPVDKLWQPHARDLVVALLAAVRRRGSFRFSLPISHLLQQGKAVQTAADLTA